MIVKLMLLLTPTSWVIRTKFWRPMYLSGGKAGL